MTADFPNWPEESLRRFAEILAPLVASAMRSEESRQHDTNWQAQNIDRLKHQRRQMMAAERKSK